MSSSVEVLRISASIACCLSIIGAFLVIFSFIYDAKTRIRWKEIYYKICCAYKIKEEVGRGNWVTKYKLKSYHFILINLSVADIIVAISHLWGLSTNLDDRFRPSENETDASNASNDTLGIFAGTDDSCTTQAAFTVLSTLSSFFWTDILAIFLMFNMVCQGCSNNYITGFRGELKYGRVRIPDKKKAPNCCESPFFLYMVFPFFGWVVPMIGVFIFATHGLLGYTKDIDQGWCYILLDPKRMNVHERRTVNGFAYELWLWGSVGIVLFCTVIYSITVCVRKKLSKGQYTTNCTEFRYLSVGIAFALLRLPSTVLNLYLFSNPGGSKMATATVLNIIASTTLSLQGTANGIIYLCCRNCIKEKFFPSRQGYVLLN